VTLDTLDWQRIQARCERIFASIPSGPPVRTDRVLPPGPRYEGIILNSPVNFVARAIDLYQSGYDFHGSAYVISNFLSNTWLWDRVRSQGGAYDSFCDFDDNSGVFAFLSYRDPNLLATLEHYDRAAAFLKQVHLGTEDIKKSIIATVREMDVPRLPDARGYNATLRQLLGKSEQDRQQLRSEVLSTTARHFRSFADVLDLVAKEGKVAVAGSQSEIEEKAQRMLFWDRITRVEKGGEGDADATQRI
jgi:Zn-dependent M16 (insulinase) family peptidase